MKHTDIQKLHDTVPREPRCCVCCPRHHRRLFQFVRFDGADGPDVLNFGIFSDRLRRLSRKETPQAYETNQIAIIRTGRAAFGFKFMKIKSSKAMLQLVAAGLLLLLTGCKTVEKHSLTYCLWDNGDLSKWSEPAPNPKLAIFETTNGADLLIQYDAFSEKHSVVKRRAYFLLRNEARIDAGKKPKLVSLAVADGMKPIAVLPTQIVVTNLPPAPAAYAVLTNVGRGFTLYRPPKPAATFDLPVYAETSGTPTRIALTPFAVAGDTVMVGVVAAVIGFCLWVQGGAPTH